MVLRSKRVIPFIPKSNHHSRHVQNKEVSAPIEANVPVEANIPIESSDSKEIVDEIQYLDLSAISLDDSVANEANNSVISISEDEANNSVVFVGEEKPENPPENSSTTECEVLRQANKKLKRRMKKIEETMQALQNRMINHAAPIETSETEPPVENQIDLDWLSNEIDQLQKDGDITATVEQIAKLLESE